MLVALYIHAVLFCFVSNFFGIQDWLLAGLGKQRCCFTELTKRFKKGERVCIATPRTDVVLELAPRLQEVFPYIKVAALYGGSVDKEKDAVLVVATTHQLLRYYRAFHVMVVDEIDAFPYCADQMLQYAVKQAMKEKAARIYLTATPDETWKRKLKQGKQKRCYCFWTISSSSFASSFILLVRELEKKPHS
ncbi:DEAD/DEAH box helicase [Bacillus cereus]